MSSTINSFTEQEPNGSTTPRSSDRWLDLRGLLTLASNFGNETGPVAVGEFDPSEDTLGFIQNEAKVLGKSGINRTNDNGVSDYVTPLTNHQR